VQVEDAVHKLPDSVAAQWQSAYYQAIIDTAAVDWQLGQIFEALHSAAVEFIWVKGGALAHTIYPTPACRARGDLDLWINQKEWARAAALLQRLGYTNKNKQNRPETLVALIGGEQQLWRSAPKPRLVELQAPLPYGEWVRYTTTIDHAGIWQRRIPLSFNFTASQVNTLTADDTLIYLCLHMAINHQFSKPWLRNLLDIHLLVASRMVDWPRTVQRIKSWRVATAVWTVLDMAQRLFAAPVPAAAWAELAPVPSRQAIIKQLHLDTILLTADELGYSYRRLLIQMALADRWRDDLHLIGRSIWPEDSWLQARYPSHQGHSTAALHLLHLKTLLFSARA